MMEKLTEPKIDQQINKEDESSSNPYQIKYNMKFAIISDESDPNTPVKIWCNSFDLCNEKRGKIELHSTATVDDTSFEVDAVSYVQCDYSFGGEFTCTEKYVFDRLNTEKFYQTLDQSSDLILLSEIIKQKFGGVFGLETLKIYCKEKDIEYHYTQHYEE